MLTVEANIRPISVTDTDNITPEELAVLRDQFMELYSLENANEKATVFFTTPVIIETDDEEVIVDQYSFVVTRRWVKNGDLHVGGAAGEAVNISELIRRVEEIVVANQ